MKKNILYIAIAVIIGLLGGYVIFGGNNSIGTENTLPDGHNQEANQSTQMWTCSMHPQIMQPEEGDCPICGMDLIPAETSAEGLASNEIKMTSNAMALANIQTTIIGDIGIDNEGRIIRLSGKIAANDENNSVQASYFDGRIEQLKVNYEGQQIGKGQLLATIYSPNLVSAQQELLTAASLRESQPQLYSAVRNKLKNWKFSETQINKIEQSGKVMENFPIYATVSGTVSIVMAAEGDYVKQGQPIVKVSNLNSVWAEFDAYENQISQFKKGQKIKITTNAYPDTEFDAIITFIDPVLDNQKRTVTIRATLNNKDDIFKPGMFIMGSVKGKSNKSEGMLIIPASAVMWTGERSLVYLKTNPNEPVFEMREVTIGSRNGENFNITSGLNYGDEIVTNGTFTVDAAAQLQGKKSMMNKLGGRTTTGHEDHLGMQEVSNNTATVGSSMKMNLPVSFQKEFQLVFQPYFKMEQAFISSDAGLVASLAKTTSEKMKSLNLNNLGKMEKAHVEKILDLLGTISSKLDIETQRSYLVLLNENIVAIAKNIKSPTETLYIQKCPMANSNKGAIWLSTTKEIKNPYYGDAMLSCGSVIDTIK
jgi:membrane fusion protein, copper/silver efflux system